MCSGDTNIKPIIIICGAPHSLTSMIQKFLIDNGAYPGEIQEKHSELTKYNKYEDKHIAEFVSKRKRFKRSSLKNYIEKLPTDKVVCLKYPLIVWFLDEIFSSTSKRQVKVVYILRNPRDTILSSFDKATDDIYKSFLYNFQRYSSIYDACVSYKFDLLPVMAERILQKRKGNLMRLLQYCDLPTEKINTSSIDQSKVRTRHMSYPKYRLKNFFWKRIGRLIKF